MLCLNIPIGERNRKMLELNIKNIELKLILKWRIIILYRH